MDAPPIAARPEEWRIVRDILRAHVPDREIWAFGSRTRGTAKPFSDLDLAVIGDTPLTRDVRAALAEAFSESDLPWKVDIVDWANTGAAFRAVVARNKVVVQAAAMADANGQTTQADISTGSASERAGLGTIDAERR